MTFAGNAQTGKATVRDYLLYRAAELTLAKGGDYFIVTTRNMERKVRPVVTHTGFGFGFGYPFSFGTVIVSGGDRAYQAYAVITIHTGEEPANNPRAYSAREVVDNLQATIKRPD